MNNEMWAARLNDPSLRYDVLDFALALVGDPDDQAPNAEPTMILHVQHWESGLEFDFTYRLVPEAVALFAATFSRMAEDIDNNTVLSDIDPPWEEE